MNSAALLSFLEAGLKLDDPKFRGLDGEQRSWGLKLGDAAIKMGVDPVQALAMGFQESRFRPRALSPKGAIGIMQVMPGTARDMGYDPEAMRKDPEMQITAGLDYMRRMERVDSNRFNQAAAYNMGPGNLKKLAKDRWPLETQGYVASVNKYMKHMGSNLRGAPNELMAGPMQPARPEPAPEMRFPPLPAPAQASAGQLSVPDPIAELIGHPVGQAPREDADPARALYAELSDMFDQIEV